MQSCVAQTSTYSESNFGAWQISAKGAKQNAAGFF
jgi:hypothetical protein